jgi:hypothetical protein
MEKEVRRYFKKGLFRSFDGWNDDKEVEMERLRAWFFDRVTCHDFYHHAFLYSYLENQSKQA